MICIVEWRYVYINDEKTQYTVDRLGRVYSEISNKYLKPYPTNQGYLLVDLHHNGRRYIRQVHRLVAIAFIPNPESLETVNHKNGIKFDNAVHNLEWMSRLNNVRHAWSTGLAKPRYGVDNPANVYSESQIHAVCALLELRKMKDADIARLCGVNRYLITDIKFKGKWKHISSLYDIPDERPGYHLLRSEIFDCFQRGYSNKETMLSVGLPVTTKSRRHIEYCRSLYNRSLND